MSGSGTVLGVVLVYGLIGMVACFALHRRGQPAATAATALVAWPWLIGLAGSGQGDAGGPFARRIDGALAALAQALAEPAVAGLADPAEVDAIRVSLATADRRVAMVDRLLADPTLGTGPEGARLRAARDRAAAEIEAVLQAMTQFRVHLGLVALAGDTLPMRARMSELTARVHALEELGLA